MTEEFYTEEVVEANPNRKWIMISAIVVGVLLICCCGSLVALWYGGDYLVDFLESAALFFA